MTCYNCDQLPKLIEAKLIGNKIIWEVFCNVCGKSVTKVQVKGYKE